MTALPRRGPTAAHAADGARVRLVSATMHAASQCGRSCSTARPRMCSARSGSSASCSSTRSRPSAPAQHVVLWSRLGATYDRGALDRLLWDTRQLFEWNAFVWPIEELPLVRALMRRWKRSTRYSHERWVRTFLAENPDFRRYVRRELAQRGPLLSRELEDRAKGEPRDHRWWRISARRAVAHVAPPLRRRGRRRTA